MSSDLESSKQRDDHRDEVCYASVKQSAALAAATFVGVLVLVVIAVFLL
jgi:hypothetical protein